MVVVRIARLQYGTWREFTIEEASLPLPRHSVDDAKVSHDDGKATPMHASENPIFKLSNTGSKFNFRPMLEIPYCTNKTFLICADPSHGGMLNPAARLR